MPYISSGDMIAQAHKSHYAIPAFNFENLEMAQAIISAAESQRSPVILQTTPSTVDYLGMKQAYAIVFSLANDATVPVALHLDHCETFEKVMQAIKAGYSSVMIDASKLPFKENISLTAKVVETAHAMGISVEAELGRVGGKEDSLKVDEVAYTVPEEAKEFVENTCIDIFAPAIGTSHGFYKGEPKLDIERLIEVQAATRLPLVLHGGSGIPDEKVQKCISFGIAKVNYATELRYAVTTAVRAVLQDKTVFDPKIYLGKAREAVKEFCIKKIAVCDSAGRA